MGLYKVDDVSGKEWERRQMRRYRIITALEVLGMIALVAGMWFLLAWASDVMHP